MGKALEGTRILDMTHVQSGPTCTQILAWFGADVIKVERPGSGDPTRGQLRDIPEVDSLYFTMLNANKRSITLNPKTEAGNKIFATLIQECDVMVENFAPGAIDRMGFPWEKIQELNPRMNLRLGEGVRRWSVRGLQGLREHRPMHRRSSVNHRRDRSGSHGDRRSDRRFRYRDPPSGGHPCRATAPREKRQGSARGMCHARCRAQSLSSETPDQQRLAHGPLTEYPQYPNGKVRRCSAALR